MAGFEVITYGRFWVTAKFTLQVYQNRQQNRFQARSTEESSKVEQ